MHMTTPPTSASMRPAAFIDRDGVINRERHYVHRIEDFELLPGVAEGLGMLRDQGYVLVVVTNQAGIARGLYSEQDFQQLTAHMHRVLNDAGASVDAVYHCPHHPTAGQGDLARACSCRKPEPGMLLQAASDLQLDLRRSVLIGDKGSDIQAGRRAGLASCVLVRSGHAVTEEDVRGSDACVDGLLEAAQWLNRLPPHVPVKP